MRERWFDVDPVLPETRELALIERALELRGRRPEAFAGAYSPLAAGPDVCAFFRGEDDVLAAVAPRAGALAQRPQRRDLPARTIRREASLLNADGLALFERER